MKVLSFLAVFSLLIISGTAQEKFSIDKSNSEVQWFGYKVNGQHNGTVEIKSANATIKSDGSIKNGKIVIDMKSIKCLDLEKPSTNKKLVDHLKSADFFEVNKYPETVYRITGSEKEGDKLKVKGVLTIKDKTNPYEFTAEIKKSGDSFKYTANWKISRGDYYVNVEEDANLVDYFKDSMIKEYFDLSINIVFK